MDFNKEQLEAINTTEGMVQVIAQAGSGKSRSLIERINNIVNKGIDEKDILTISFTNASASDLKEKLAEYGLYDVCVGTFHSISKMILEENGYANLMDFPNQYRLKREIETRLDMKNINLNDILSWIAYQKVYELTPSSAQFKFKESNYEEYILINSFKIYEEYKTKTNTYDFTDWLILCKELYESGKGHKWEYVLIDENQDSNLLQTKLAEHFCKTNNLYIVGDFSQCWEENCEVRLKDGSIKKVKDLQIGDLVECNRGGNVKYMPVTNKTKHIKDKLVKITTEKGYSITTTIDHKFFVHDPYFSDDIIYLYLMFRHDKGFRIGLTSGGKTKDIRSRVNTESPDRLWLLKRFDNNKEEAYYQEELYSLRYRIPKIPFHTNGRCMAMGQEKTNEIFDEFGKNGYQLLKDFNMDFNYPNYVCQNTGNKYPTIKLYHYAEHHGSVQYSVEFEYQGKRIRKTSNNFKECYLKAQEILKTTEANSIFERLSLKCVDKTPYRAVCGSNVMIGMDTPVVVDGEFHKDIITNIEYINEKSTVYDIEVASSGTMVANNILTHNCIYAFQGATPEVFKNFPETHKGTKVINMNTNYRSCRNIVDAANEFIMPYNSDYKHYKAAYANNRADGIIETKICEDVEEETEWVISKIKKFIKAGEDLNDMAVLYRNHSCADVLEARLKDENIPYKITNNGSFFEKAEIKNIVSILRLVQSLEDDEALETLLKSRLYPTTYFKGNLIDELRVESGKKNCSMYEALLDHHFDKSWERNNVNILSEFITRIEMQIEKHLSLDKVINNITKMFKVNDWLRERYIPSAICDKLDSINNFKGIAKGNNLTTLLSLCNNKIKMDNKKSGIDLKTVHNSKGLEYKITFVIGLQEKKFPSERAIDEVDKIKEEAEEARLMYVATTRAKEQLYLSSIGISKFYDKYKAGLDKINKRT